VTNSHSSPLPTLAELEGAILTFLKEYVLDPEYDGLDPLAELTLDSLALEQLLDHLEETYRVLFDPEDVSRANLSSVPSAARMVFRTISAVRSGDRSW
jgi:acyl carrier protein